MKGNQISKQSSSKVLLILCLIFAFLCSPITRLFTKISKVFASSTQLTDVEGKEVQVVGFDSTAVLGEAVRLPKVIVGDKTYDAKTNDGTELVYDIQLSTSTTKVSVDDITAGNDGYYYFTPAKEGVYVLDIHTVNDGKLVTYAKGLQITVTKSTATFSVDNSAVVKGTDSAYVLPEKISITDLVSADFKMPAPVIDEEVNPVSLTLIPAGVTDKTKYITMEYNATNKYYTIKDADKATLTTDNRLGEYSFIYSYIKNGVKIATDVILKTEVVANENFADDIELKISSLVSSTELSAGEIGTWITLPTATIYDNATGTTDSIPAILSISVTANSDVKDRDNVKIELDGYNFKANKLGSYAVTYTANYPYTNKTVEKVFNITLKDTTSPEVLFVEEYTARDTYFTTNTTATEEDFVKSLTETKLQSVYVLENGKVNVTLPAIYAKDNSTDGGYAFTREYVKPNSETVPISTADNEDHPIELTAEGVYTINYRVTDPNGKSTTAKFQFVVVDEETLLSLDASATTLNELTKPSIKTGSVNRTVDVDGTISFNVPTATDALADNFKEEYSALTKYSSTWKSNVELTTTIYACDANGKISGASYKFTEDDINSTTNQYELNLAEHSELTSTATATHFVIEYSAITDWMKEVGINAYVKTSSKIEYINAGSDKTAPKIALAQYDNNTVLATDSLSTLIYEHNKTMIDAYVDSYNAEKGTSFAKAIGNNGMLTDGTNFIAPFNQYSAELDNSIVLPDLIITDAEDANTVSVTGTITDAQGNETKFLPEVTGIKLVADKHNYYVTLGEHKLTSAGLYTISITAQDMGGNITVYSFGIMVNDTTSPSDITLDADIVGERTINKTYYTGEYIYFPEAEITDNADEDCTYTVKLTSMPTGANVTKNNFNRGFETLTAGTYEITYTCTDSSNNTLVKIYKLEVTEKNHTSVSVDETYFPTDFKYAWDVTTTTKRIDLPYGVAINNVDTSINGEKIKPTVATSSGTTQNVKEDGDAYYFNAAQGIYTITYKYDSKTSVSYTIYVGDTDKPTLTWKEDVPTTLDINETWGADLLNMFTVSDYKNGLKNDENVDITIKIKAPDNSTKTIKGVNDTTVQGYKFDKEGSYTLTIELTDGVTPTTITKTITVSTEDGSTTNNPTNVVGIVLLIASILVVGGVVLYLIISSKNKSKKNQSK